MWEQAEALKLHSHLLLPETLQLAATHSYDINVLDTNRPRRGFDQAIEMAYECGLAGTGETHDDVDAAFLYGQGNIPQPEGVTTALQKLVPAHAGAGGFQPLLGPGPEDFVYTLYFDLGHIRTPCADNGGPTPA